MPPPSGVVSPGWLHPPRRLLTNDNIRVVLQALGAQLRRFQTNPDLTARACVELHVHPFTEANGSRQIVTNHDTTARARRGAQLDPSRRPKKSARSRQEVGKKSVSFDV